MRVEYDEGEDMLNIMRKENRSFEALRDYFKEVRGVVSKDKDGNFVDPFGNRIYSFKMDELGNLLALALASGYSQAYNMILMGDPEKKFEAQGSDDRDSYRYVFEGGRCVAENSGGEGAYVRRLYGEKSEDRPIFESKVLHGGPFETRRWSADGRTLLYKRVRFMDQDCIDHVATEFCDSKGQRCVMTSLRQNRQVLQMRMSHVDSMGNKELVWHCKRDDRNNMVFYNAQDEITRVVPLQVKKQSRVPVGRAVPFSMEL